MGKSQKLGTLVCGGVSYTPVLSFHMVLSYPWVSTVLCSPSWTSGAGEGMTIERIADIAHGVVSRGVLRFCRNGYCERTPMRIPLGFRAAVNVPIAWALPTRSVSMPSKLIPQAELMVPTMACGPSPTDWQGRGNRQNVPLYSVLSRSRVCRTGLLTETSSSKLKTSPLGGESIWTWGPVLIWNSACELVRKVGSLVFLTLLCLALWMNRS